MLAGSNQTGLLNPTSWLNSLSPGNLARKPLELFLVHHLVVDHTDQELLDGAAAKAVDNLFDCAGGDVLPGFDWLVDESAALNFMRKKALLFQSSKDGAHGRVLHGPAVTQRRAARFSSRPPVGPAILHHQFFQLPQALWLFFLSAIHGNVTHCNISTESGQAKNEGPRVDQIDCQLSPGEAVS